MYAFVDAKGTDSSTDPPATSSSEGEVQTEEGFPVQPSTMQSSAEGIAEVQLPSLGNTTITDVNEPRPLTTRSMNYPRVQNKRFCTCKRSPRINFLRATNASRDEKLSPLVKKLHEFIRNIQANARRLHTENASNQEHLRHAIDAENSAKMFRSQMSETSFNSLLSQFKLRQTNKSQGRLFTIEDKTFALFMLKRSPKMYRFLSKMFALPSIQCLQSLLDRIQIGPGINTPILEMLRDACDGMDKEEKYCALLFDEMPLTPELYFNQMGSTIDGFAFCSEQTKLGFADRVMVFMVRGILKKWKQPIAYFFLESDIGVADLAQNIKTIIGNLQEIGLRVVCTVCDQRATNVATIKGLIQETSPPQTYFLVGGEEIFPLIDPPHLLKCVRNNLLKYSAGFEWKGTNYTSCWSDIVKLYALDNADPDPKILPKLTECHIYESKMNKTKVKLATEVFSERTSAAIKFLVKYGDETHVTETMLGTSEFLLFFDKLFDSVNGSSMYYDDKPLRCAISAMSEHVAFYSEAIQVLRTIKFKTPVCDFVPPCIANWITTLKGLQCVWNKLQSEGVKNLCPRNLNQDPLKNVLSRMRSRNVLNTKPTCSTFKASYRAIIVGNLMTIYSPYANCEDDCRGAINFLQNFLTKDFFQPATMIPPIISEVFAFKNVFNFLADNSNACIAGYLGRHLLRKLEGCDTCKSALISDTSEVCTHSYIECRTYSKGTLLKPDTPFYKYLGKSFQIIHHYLPKFCTFSNIVPFLKARLSSFISPTYFHCQRHDLVDMIDNFLIPFYIVMWIQDVNSILKGKGKMKSTDDIKKLAVKKNHKIMSRHFAILKAKN